MQSYYDQLMGRFDKDEWDRIFNTVKDSIGSLVPENIKCEDVPITMQEALLYQEVPQILGVTSMLYRFHKELETYKED